MIKYFVITIFLVSCSHVQTNTSRGVASVAANGSIPSESIISRIDTKSKNIYTAMISRAVFSKTIVLDLNKDDDIYFQGGSVVTEDSIDKTRPHCSIDTDVEKIDVDRSLGNFIHIKNGVMTIEKGLIRAIEKVTVFPLEGHIEYDIDFIKSEANPPTDVIDELECSVPFSITRPLTVGGIGTITGEIFKFDVIDIESSL